MNIAKRLSDFQAGVILTALAVLMLGVFFWGITHPASDRQPSDSPVRDSTANVAAVSTPSAAVMKIVRILLEPTLTTSSIPPEALVGPNERVELDMSEFGFTFEGVPYKFAPAEPPNIPDFSSPAPNQLKHTSTTVPMVGDITQPQSEDSSEDSTEGK